MSELRVDNIVSQDGTAAPTYTQGIIVAAGKTINNQGDFDVSGNSEFSGYVRITNTGITTVDGTLNVAGTGTNTYSGDITLSGDMDVTGSLNVTGGGTLNTSGIITASLIDVTSDIQYANLSVLTGNVGIGTTFGYGGRLNVNDDIVLSTGISTTSDMAIRAYTSNGGMISFEDIDGDKSYFSITKDEDTLFSVNDTSFNSKVVVGAAGSIGIGTTAPDTALLQVDVVGGDVRVGRSESEGLILTSNNGSQFRVKVDNSGNLSTTAL